ncbi:hypothetical protein AAY473_011203 [Plecturocebus cupreus]
MDTENSCRRRQACEGASHLRSCKHCPVLHQELCGCELLGAVARKTVGKSRKDKEEPLEILSLYTAQEDPPGRRLKDISKKGEDKGNQIGGHAAALSRRESGPKAKALSDGAQACQHEKPLFVAFPGSICQVFSNISSEFLLPWAEAWDELISVVISAIELGAQVTELCRWTAPLQIQKGEPARACSTQGRQRPEASIACGIGGIAPLSAQTNPHQVLHAERCRPPPSPVACGLRGQEKPHATLQPLKCNVNERYGIYYGNDSTLSPVSFFSDLANACAIHETLLRVLDSTYVMAPFALECYFQADVIRYKILGPGTGAHSYNPSTLEGQGWPRDTPKDQARTSWSLWPYKGIPYDKLKEKKNQYLVYSLQMRCQQGHTRCETCWRESLTSSCFGELLETLDLKMHLSSRCLCLHTSRLPSVFCVFLSSYVDTNHLESEPPLLQFGIILTNHICKDPISK